MISILSEKRISIPELALELPAQKGFSVIATANTRDKGVNEMSAALKRRFNIVILPPPSDMSTEMVNLMQTQRAFQLNSRIVSTADQMEEMINNLR